MTCQTGRGESLDSNYFQKVARRSHVSTLKQFKKTTALFAWFKLGFLFLFAAEVLFLMWFFVFFAQSSLFAIFLGVIFLTVFTYLVLLFYFQTKKPEQFEKLKERFLQSCRQVSGIPREAAEHHLMLAQSALKLVSELQGYEEKYYKAPNGSAFLSSFFSKLGTFLHQEDVFLLKEELLYGAIDEHVAQIQITPTDLEVHASLAHTYVVLSRLYLEAQNSVSSRLGKNVEAKLAKKFEMASLRAIEELKILNDYAPNDPWVHAQLAQSYQTLKMPSEESVEYEILLKLSPNDKEVLFRLGRLYFELGQNAKGLRVYEELKKMSYKKAEDLIAFYGMSRSLDSLEEMSRISCF
jgi:tetratricopeptide (TPR) repeat protein